MAKIPVNTSRNLTAAVLVVVLFSSVGCSPVQQSAQDAITQPTVSAQSSSANIANSGDQQCKVETELSSMPLDTKIGQLMTVGVSSTQDAEMAIETYNVGGIFIGSDIAESFLASGEVAELHDRSSLRPLIAIDEEGGRVSHISSIVGPIPSARDMAETMTVTEVRDLARQRGEDLRRLGVTVDFAPSIDVSDQPDAGVIGDRSFAADPEVVVKYARAFAEGLLESDITPVFKHFPGHGSSSGDSHLEPVTVPPLSQLKNHDLIPFAELIGMPGTAAMIGHMQVPELTAPGEAASMSPAAYALLRSGVEYGGPVYNGVIFTDDLAGMRAITDSYTVPEAVVQALIAGADSPLWVSTTDLAPTIEAVRAAVNDGRLSEARIDASLTRLHNLHCGG